MNIKERYEKLDYYDELFKDHKYLKGEPRTKEFWYGYVSGVSNAFTDICNLEEVNKDTVRDVLFEHMKFGDEKRHEKNGSSN